MDQRTPKGTHFPYTTLFRSSAMAAVLEGAGAASAADGGSGDGAGVDPLESVFAASRLGDVAGAGALSSGADELRAAQRSEEHTSELQSRRDLVCRLLLEKKN